MEGSTFPVKYFQGKQYKCIAFFQGKFLLCLVHAHGHGKQLCTHYGFQTAFNIGNCIKVAW